MKRVSAYTLGCKVNQYDTTAMLELLRADGYEIVKWGEVADVYIVNTCTVTNVADKKSRNIIRRAAKQNPHAFLCVCGCLAQGNAAEIESIPGVDAVIGTENRHSIVDIVRAGVQGKAVNATTDIARVAAYEPLHVQTTGERTRGYVKIQEGCNSFCSYCIIPYVRGRSRSRESGDVLTEVRALAQNGITEVVLTGIHISSYGESADALPRLLEDISNTGGIRRIRLGSLEPGAMTEAFIQHISQLPKVCPHFHISLQSGSAQVLRRMNRHYTPEQYMRVLELLRDCYSDPAITTDIITGFPGETEQEFMETCAFVEKARFSHVHVFPYSERQGTAAARMRQVPIAVRRERAQRLIGIALQQEQAYIRGMLGSVQHVILEEHRDGAYEGYTSRYIRVRIPASPEMQIGQYIPVILRGMNGVTVEAEQADKTERSIEK